MASDRENIINNLRSAYDGVDGLFNFSPEIDKAIKEQVIPFLVDVIRKDYSEGIK